jgi:serine O-acetyltransferase
LKVRELLSLIKSDLVRLAELWDKKLTFLGGLKMLMTPAMLAIILYRISHFFYMNNMRFLSWPLWALNITLTGSDINPTTIIGRGFFLGHSVGNIITGRLGNNVMVFGKVGIGGGVGDLTKDVGAGPGMPYIKDNVQIGVGAMILGPIVVEESVKIAPCTYLYESVPKEATVYGNPAKIKVKKSAVVD